MQWLKRLEFYCYIQSGNNFMTSLWVAQGPEVRNIRPSIHIGVLRDMKNGVGVWVQSVGQGNPPGSVSQEMRLGSEKLLVFSRVRVICKDLENYNSYQTHGGWMKPKEGPWRHTSLHQWASPLLQTLSSTLGNKHRAGSRNKGSRCTAEWRRSVTTVL